MKRQRRKAFTLVELLLVMAILAVLASVVTVSIVQVQKMSNIRAARSQIGMLAQAVEMYRIDMGIYPDQLSDLQVQPSNLRNPEKWHPFIEKEIPLDPWRNEYQFQVLDNGDRFIIYSFGPNGSEGGGDDIRSDDVN
jgi:general secretion pathway protein G